MGDARILVVLAKGKNSALIEALVIPPMRDTAAHGWGTHFCWGCWRKTKAKTEAGPSLLLHPSDEDLSPGTPGLKDGYGQDDGTK